jgi:DNA-binding transcriptional LysR family regulator
MELRQLEYFVAVVEEANFTRGAARVHVAQPGVSAQIRRLEREAVDELVGLRRGRVAIGMVTSVPSEVLDLPALLAGFHTAHPAVDISLTVATTDELVEALHAGRLDIAVVGVGTGMPDGIGIEVITSEPFVAVVAHTDALAKRRSITLRALSERQLISLPKGAGMRSSIDAAFRAAMLAPKISFEAGDPRLVAELAATGLGVGIVPKSVAEARRAVLHTIAITGPAMHGEMALAWRDAGPISPATRTLVNRLRDAILAQHAGTRS